MTRVYFAFALALTVAAWASAAIAHPYLPQRVPIHWNIRGEVDGYGDKAWATFLVPAGMVALLILFRLLPWLSPKSFSLDTFRGTYEFVVALTMGLMAYIHGLMLWAALMEPLDMGRALLGGICLFFALLGNVLGKVRRNFFVGVRTPWTLASERVWIDTHRLAARLFVAAGLAGFVLCLVLGGPAAFTVTFALIMIAAFAPVVYSLVHYKHLERQGLA
ncbi:MAG TPA: SdpI family protein [Pirellulales bacterium]|nr:SdpI family protein [Pirellulales bacterium]